MTHPKAGALIKVSWTGICLANPPDTDSYCKEGPHLQTDKYLWDGRGLRSEVNGANPEPQPPVTPPCQVLIRPLLACLPASFDREIISVEDNPVGLKQLDF